MRHRTFAAAATVAAAATLLAAGAAPAQPGPSSDRSQAPRATARIADLSPDGVAIQGKVAEVFGNRFVLQDESGRTLVETGPSWYRAFEPRRDERLTVVGRPKDGAFEAVSVHREGGERIDIRRPDGPPPWAGGPGRGGPRDRRAEMRIDEDEARRLLERAGYKEIRELERKPRHYEAQAVNARGEQVEVHLGAGGEVRRERPVEGGGRRGDADAPPDAEVRRVAERLGFRVEGRIKRGDEGVEFEARDARGDRFEVELDQDGRLREVERMD